MNRYTYIEIFERPLQDEKLVRRIDTTELSREDRQRKVKELYGSDYPIEKFQLVITDRLKKS